MLFSFSKLGTLSFGPPILACPGRGMVSSNGPDNSMLPLSSNAM